MATASLLVDLKERKCLITKSEAWVSLQCSAWPLQQGGGCPLSKEWNVNRVRKLPCFCSNISDCLAAVVPSSLAFVVQTAFLPSHQHWGVCGLADVTGRPSGLCWMVLLQEEMGWNRQGQGRGDWGTGDGDGSIGWYKWGLWNCPSVLCETPQAELIPWSN